MTSFESHQLRDNTAVYSLFIG